jgi:ribosomal protein S18
MLPSRLKKAGDRTITGQSAKKQRLLAGEKWLL